MVSFLFLFLLERERVYLDRQRKPAPRLLIPQFPFVDPGFVQDDRIR